MRAFIHFVLDRHTTDVYAQNIRAIVDVRLNDVESRLKDRKIKLEADDKVRDWLAEEGMSIVFVCMRVRLNGPRDVGAGAVMPL